MLGTTNKDPEFENHGIVAWSTCAMANNVELTIVLISKYIVNQYIIFFKYFESGNKLYVNVLLLVLRDMLNSALRG